MPAGSPTARGATDAARGRVHAGRHPVRRRRRDRFRDAHPRHRAPDRERHARHRLVRHDGRVLRLHVRRARRADDAHPRCRAGRGAALRRLQLRLDARGHPPRRRGARARLRRAAAVGAAHVAALAARARRALRGRRVAGVGLPIILYNYPARAGVEIGFDALDAIADLPEIVAIKESSGDFSRFLTLRRRYDGPHRGHVRLGRSGRRLLLVGRAQLARRHRERPPAPARRGARGGAARRPRARASPVRGDAAVGAGHGERQLQPEGEARARARRASTAARCASRCCRSTDERRRRRRCACSTRRSRSSFPSRVAAG